MAITALVLVYPITCGGEISSKLGLIYNLMWIQINDSDLTHCVPISSSKTLTKMRKNIEPVLKPHFWLQD